MKIKKYRLLKDDRKIYGGEYIIFKAGSILESTGYMKYYDYVLLQGSHAHFYERSFVENNPEWFEEIKEE